MPTVTLKQGTNRLLVISGKILNFRKGSRRRVSDEVASVCLRANRLAKSEVFSVSADADPVKKAQAPEVAEEGSRPSDQHELGRGYGQMRL